MSQRRVKRSKDEVSRLLGEWRSSGLSAREFGELEDIPVSTLYQWVRRTSNAKTTARRSNRDDKFVAMDIAESCGSGESGSFRVVLQAGREVEVLRGFDANELARLVKVLEA